MGQYRSEATVRSSNPTNRGGWMSRVPASRSGRSWNPNLMGLNPGHVKPMTLKLILSNLALSIIRTGWLSVRIMWLTRIADHSAGSLMSQRGSTIKVAITVHPWNLYSVALQGDQGSIMTWFHTQSHYPDTELTSPRPILGMQNARLGDWLPPRVSSIEHIHGENCLLFNHFLYTECKSIQSMCVHKRINLKSSQEYNLWLR